MSWISMHAPVGDLTLHEHDGKIISLDWGWAPDCPDPIHPILQTAKNQLDDYFDGLRETFDLSLDPHGTPRQKETWQVMAQIPYGASMTYGDLANRLNSAARAVGSACAANPVPILIPCHRVMGANKKLNGYSGGEGLSTKADLLRLEGFTDFKLPRE